MAHMFETECTTACLVSIVNGFPVLVSYPEKS